MVRRRSIFLQRLKGNRVRIPNSPAAVSFIRAARQPSHCFLGKKKMGRRHAEKQVRRPAMCDIDFNSRGKGKKDEGKENIFFRLIFIVLYSRFRTRQYKICDARTD